MLVLSIPFLISAMTLGTVLGITLFSSIVILTIPVFATRGKAQFLWLAVVGLLVTIETAVFVTLVVLQSTGDITL